MAQATRNLRLVAYACAFAATPAMMYLGYTLFAHDAGANLGLYDVAGDYVEGVAAAMVCLVLIALLPVRFEHRRALAVLWLVRTGIALGAMLAYEAWLRGDFVYYYNHGTGLNDPLAHFAFADGLSNVTALVGLMAQVTDAYNALKVVFSFIGLMAVYIFYRTATICLGQDRILLLYVLGLFPSFLFWTSLFGKEPIVMFGIAVFALGAAGVVVQRRAGMVALVIVGLLIASAIRPWLGTIFLAPLLVTLVLGSRVPMVAKGAFLTITVPLFLFALQAFATRFQLDSAEDLVNRVDFISQSWAYGGAAQRIQGFSSLYDLVAFVPLGAFTALFRPLPGEVMTAFGILAGLENAFLLGLIVIGLTRRGVGWMAQPALLWAAATLIIWAAAYGFVSYQNLGGGFRYRTMVTPFLLMLGLYLTFGHHLKEAGQRRAGPRAVPRAVPEVALGRRESRPEQT